ncbi:MAG: hypothetical protein ACXWXR_00450 [Candidatus Limnocylindrales bacterium]
MPPSSWIPVASIAGLVAGLVLVARGLAGYRTALRVADTSTSTISSAAAGEVRISGVVEPAELTLVSLLQSAPCVYYRASIGNGGDASIPDSAHVEERSVGFKVRDATGLVRVFPRGARVDAPLRFHDETGLAGDEPPGLAIRTGPATQTADVDRATAIADLLTVHDPPSTTGPPVWPGLRGRDGRSEYRETRLETGDAVTVVGLALPFRDLDDPAGADLGMGGIDVEADPEVAADLADARAAGSLARDPDAAWGNAAIPGFGIGRPVTAPVIDPAANPLPLATGGAAALVERRFAIQPDELVIAASDEVPLLIAYGTPGAVVGRDQARFAVGLLGAGLAIASALVLALSAGGGLGA